MHRHTDGHWGGRDSHSQQRLEPTEDRGWGPVPKAWQRSRLTSLLSALLQGPGPHQNTGKPALVPGNQPGRNHRPPAVALTRILLCTDYCIRGRVHVQTYPCTRTCARHTAEEPSPWGAMREWLGGASAPSQAQLSVPGRGPSSEEVLRVCRVCVGAEGCGGLGGELPTAGQA